MDFASKWSSLLTSPSLKHLTEAGYGIPKEKQHAAVQDLTKAHIESFDQAVSEGLCRAVQVGELSRGTVSAVSAVPPQATMLAKRIFLICLVSTCKWCV